jgi:hypothetical protein
MEGADISEASIEGAKGLDLGPNRNTRGAPHGYVIVRKIGGKTILKRDKSVQER